MEEFRGITFGSRYFNFKVTLDRSINRWVCEEICQGESLLPKGIGTYPLEAMRDMQEMIDAL